MVLRGKDKPRKRCSQGNTGFRKIQVKSHKTQEHNDLVFDAQVTKRSRPVKKRHAAHDQRMVSHWKLKPDTRLLTFQNRGISGSGDRRMKDLLSRFQQTACGN